MNLIVSEEAGKEIQRVIESRAEKTDTIRVYFQGFG